MAEIFCLENSCFLVLMQSSTHIIKVVEISKFANLKGMIVRQKIVLEENCRNFGDLGSYEELLQHIVWFHYLVFSQWFQRYLRLEALHNSFKRWYWSGGVSTHKFCQSEAHPQSPGFLVKGTYTILIFCIKREKSLVQGMIILYAGRLL